MTKRMTRSDKLNGPEDGKQCLPEQPELENEEPEAHEPNVEEGSEQAGSEPTFSEKDKKDFPALEKQWEQGGRQEAEAVREIRQRQLWRLIRNEEGKQLYANFEEYCGERWGHTRQWATHITNWLAIAEEMDRLGITDPPHLSVRAVEGLVIGRLKDAGGLRVVLEEAKQDAVPFDRDHLREIVVRRADYNYYSREGTEGNNKPAAKTYDEYKKDLAIVKPLGKPGSYSLFDEAVEAARSQSKFGTALADSLVTLAERQQKMPDQTRLLANFTGTALEELVDRLLKVASGIKEVEAKKALLAERKKEIKLLQAGDIKKLKDEAAHLESELVAVGAIKKKGKSEASASEDDGRGIPFPAPDADEDDEEDEDEEDSSEVLANLDEALGALDLALAAAWPLESEELSSILQKAQECEAKLAEVSARAKEHLSEVCEPEVISFGDKS